ncbi:MAG: porin [Bacteroidota bacterium]
MGKHLLAILLWMGLGGLGTTYAQNGLLRKVYLTNNESFVGELVGVNPSVSYTFKDPDGRTKVIPFETVVEIEKVLPSEATIPVSTATDAAEEKDQFQIAGSVDVYYQYNFNEQPLPTSFTEYHDAFTLGMANIILSKKFKKVGFNADLALGPRAEAANGHPGTTLSAIKQLYIFYSPIKSLTFTAGNFSTFVGYELINPGENVHYSTSYLFSNGPFFHTGLKVDYALSESLSLMLGVFNDTDSKFDETQGKHFGTQVTLSRNNFSVFINYLTGIDVDLPGSRVRGHQVDLTASKDFEERFSLGLNVSRKINQREDSPDTDWLGAALYAKYQATEVLTFGLRGEYMNDPDGIILEGNSGDLLSVTFSTNVKYHGFTVIPEFRVDRANDPVFPSGENDFSELSPALLMALIYAF